MKLAQIRNATLTLQLGEEVFLVDPMLAPEGAIPALKYVTARRRRNPVVGLPPETPALLERVTACLITHCQRGHFDHLDRAGAKWLRQRELPVYCPAPDAEFLARKGLRVTALEPGEDNLLLGGRAQLVPCLHGRGLVGSMMAHGFGYYLRFPGEPSVYLCGDTVLTDDVRNFVAAQQPDVLVIPAGGARFDFGGEIIMGLDDALETGALAEGQVVANHLEALDHCPVSREELRDRVEERGWSHRFFVPGDGETLTFAQTRP